jgi:hypothetical protein
MVVSPIAWKQWTCRNTSVKTLHFSSICFHLKRDSGVYVLEWTAFQSSHPKLNSSDVYKSCGGQRHDSPFGHKADRPPRGTTHLKVHKRTLVESCPFQKRDCDNILLRKSLTDRTKQVSSVKTSCSTSNQSGKVRQFFPRLQTRQVYGRLTNF